MDARALVFSLTVPLLAGAVPAAAATITTSVSFQGSVFCFDSDTTTAVVSGATSSASCSSALVSGDGTSTGQFGLDGLELGIELLLSGNADAFGGRASVLFVDLITLVGGTAGSDGFMRLVFAVDGSLTLTGDNEFTSGSAALTFGSAFAGFSQSFSLTGPALITVDYPFTFGTAGPLIVSLSGTANSAFSANLFTANLDFLNTASLQSVQVLDANLTVLENGRVVSEAGLQYPDAAVAPIPEPATVLLVGAGGVVMAYRRWRSQGRDRRTQRPV